MVLCDLPLCTSCLPVAQSNVAFTCYQKCPIPTYVILRMNLLHSSVLLLEIIKCSIQLVDNHINIHR